MPGSRDATPWTQVSFLGVPATRLRVLSVQGSVTGAHAGRLLAYSQGDGASFVPSHAFAPGEQVTVRASVRSGSATRPLLDVFRVATPDPLSSTPEATHPGAPSEEQAFHSRPDLRPPVVKVTTSSPATAPGDIFTAPYGGPGKAGPMILDSSGRLVWFKALPPNVVATNLRVQEYLGKPALTWWQGRISVHGFGMGEGVIANSRYEDVAHVHAGNGLQEDLHELQLTPSGTALITAYFPILCNLSGLGSHGNAYAGVTDGVMQEIDLHTGLVMFEWSSLDHVALGDSFSQLHFYEATQYPFDFFHINSINLDRDGSLLIGSRNTWTVYDVNAATGLINWRLGGKHSSFKLEAQARTAWQHDPRELPDGSFSIFDNGSSPRIHAQSRGLVLALNPQKGTATVQEQLLHAPGLTAESEGNVQALPNGDWFVGWGQEPFFSELSANGKQQLFDARFDGHTRSYRSLRFPWVGTPSHPPTYAFVASSGGGGTVYASWNGATQVASWRALVGGSPATMQPLPAVARSGFETAIALPAGTVGPVLAVQALGAAGEVLGTSEPAAQSALR